MKAVSLPTDELFQLERRIARRADELASQHGTNPGRALDHWRQAESEVWHRNLALHRQVDSGWVCGELVLDGH